MFPTRFQNLGFGNLEESGCCSNSGWEKKVLSHEGTTHDRIHIRALALLAGLGVYQDGVAKTSVNSKPVIAHIFEYTTQVSIDHSLQFK